MPKTKNKIVRTRHESSRYAGLPSELPTSDLPTYRQVVQYSYLLEKTLCDSSNISSPNIVSKVASDLMNLWSAVNPRLPMIHEKSLHTKISRLFLKVITAEKKCKDKENSKKYLDCKFEKLFDLSACDCGLPVLTCNDRLERVYQMFGGYQ